MELFWTSSILVGFVRLCVIVLFLFYLSRKFIAVDHRLHLLDFIVLNWYRYAAVLTLTLFVLVEVSAYNLFNCFVIFTLLLLIDWLGWKNIIRPRAFIAEKFKAHSLRYLKLVETKKSIFYWLSFRKSTPEHRIKNWILFFTPIFIGITTFLSRYYFVQYDNYSLSDAWINDLTKLIKFDNQYWFTYELATDAELALANFYGKVTDVSPIIALQVIAILESTILAIIVFWVIHRLAPSRYIAPLLAALFFGLVYVVTPINVYYLLKGNPLFLALAFALPAFVFYIQPKQFKGSTLSYLFSFFAVFVSVGLTDLITFFILIPLFLVIGLFTTSWNVKKYNLRVLAVYGLSVGVILTIYYFACASQKVPLDYFLQSNMLSVTAYTYLPQLILPYKTIIYYTQWCAMIGTILWAALYFFKKEKGRGPLVFFMYFNVLVVVTHIKSEWLDRDLLYNSFVVFIPIVLGFTIAMLINLLQTIPFPWFRFSPFVMGFTFVGMLYGALNFQKSFLQQLIPSDATPKYMLYAYDNIAKTYFSYTYTIVNDQATQVISNNSHFFMNYEDFLSQYLEKDAQYERIKKNKKIMQNNPDQILSKSVLVFVLDKNHPRDNSSFSENIKYYDPLMKQLQELKNRGREVNVFYRSPLLTVYEVVNNPNESKISDIIFK